MPKITNACQSVEKKCVTIVFCVEREIERQRMNGKLSHCIQLLEGTCQRYYTMDAIDYCKVMSSSVSSSQLCGVNICISITLWMRAISFQAPELTQNARFPCSNNKHAWQLNLMLEDTIQLIFSLNNFPIKSLAFQIYWIKFNYSISFQHK